MSCKQTLILMVVTACAWQVRAALYYVDYASGDDVNKGTSTLTPWQHCPGDTAATGIAASTTPASGDTVIFKGGVTYTVSGARKITISQSGSSGSPITYRSGDQVGWGTTPAFIDVSDGSLTNSTLSLNKVGWITIDGLIVANLTNNYDYIGLIGGSVSSAGNITIQNCTLTNSGGCGIYLQGQWGNSAANPSTMTVSNCVVHHSNWHGVFFRYGFDNVVITNCVIHDTGEPIYPGRYEGDNICLYKGSSDQMNNIKIDGNEMYTTPTKGYILFYTPITGLSVSGNYFHGTNRTGGLMFACGLTNSVFYNNVFHTTLSQYEGIYRFNTGSGDMVVNGMKICNNTIRAHLASGAIFYFTDGNCPFETMFYNVSIMNCIVDSTAAIPIIQIDSNTTNSAPLMDMATFSCDYNTYAVASGNLFKYRGSGQTLAQWRDTIKGDTNSVNATPTFMGSGQTLHLASSDTVATGQGENLSSFFSTDRDGNPRPSSGPWSIGAYVNVLAAKLAAPPNLRIGP